MKIKTSELTGAALDWAVEFANNPELIWGDTIGLHWASRTIVIPALVSPDCYRHPSTNWAQGGPIIEREKMLVDTTMDESIWVGQKEMDRAFYQEVGPTPLIAAMRCYVASKLGDEVEIPEELS